MITAYSGLFARLCVPATGHAGRVCTVIREPMSADYCVRFSLGLRGARGQLRLGYSFLEPRRYSRHPSARLLVRIWHDSLVS